MPGSAPVMEVFCELLCDRARVALSHVSGSGRRDTGSLYHSRVSRVQEAALLSFVTFLGKSLTTAWNSSRVRLCDESVTFEFWHFSWEKFCGRLRFIVCPLGPTTNPSLLCRFGRFSTRFGLDNTNVSLGRLTVKR